MAIIPKPATNIGAALTPQEIEKRERMERWTDDAVLKIVTQDAENAENFELTKQWVLQWPTAAILYQSPFSARYWEGTQVERANVPFFTVAKTVRTVAPQVGAALFFDDPPFMLQPRPGTLEQAARAVTAILNFQIEDIGFRHQLELGINNALLFGTAIWKWGWEIDHRTRKIYRLKQGTDTTAVNPLPLTDKRPKLPIQDTELEVVEEEENIDRPTFENIADLRYVMVDPGLRESDIRKAKYVVHRMYLTWNDLERLRNRPGFDIPTKEELLSFFTPPAEQANQAVTEVQIQNPLWDARADARYEKQTIDPFNQPLEVLERWDNDNVMVVLQKKIVIANMENPYGVIPFLSVNWWDIPDAFYGLGLARTIGTEQRLQQGITNSWLDNLALNLNGVYIRVKGKSIPTQSIRISPGKIVEVDAQGDFEPLKRTQAVPEALESLRESAMRVNEMAGVGEFGGSPSSAAHSNLGRTAEGARLLASGSNMLQEFIDKLTYQVFIPFLIEAHELNSALMPLSTLQHILDDELAHDYPGDILDIKNARVRFSVLAGAKLTARKNMAQALPILIQFLLAQPTIEALAIEGKKPEIKEVIRMLLEVSEWKNYHDVVVDMSPEDKKRWMMTLPGAQAAVKGQQQGAQSVQAFQQKQQLIDQENISRAGREILRHALMQAGTPEAVTGQPGGEGFGINA